MLTHLRALQDIANANRGNRADGTPGYDASVDYVAKVLRGRGFEVLTPQFERLYTASPGKPMLTVTGDTLAGYGPDASGGRVHDLLGTRCDPYVNRMLSGEDFDFHCHSNLTRAVLPLGLTEFDVHDVLNVFQCTGLNSEDRYFMAACPARRGDHFEFFAEFDLLCALSTCPGGDLSVPLWGPEAGDPLQTCKPLGVEVYRPDPQLLRDWSSPPRAAYRNLHGMHRP